MRSRHVLVALFVLSAPRIIVAQEIAPAAVAPRTSDDSLKRDSKIAPFAIRSLSGTVGFVVGVVAGVGLAAATGPHDCGGCDDPGLGEALLGAGLGGAVGAAFGASLPNLGARCGSGGRFGRAIAGSLVGTVAGVVIGFNSGSDAGAWVIGWPIGAVLGASVSLIGC